MRRFAEVALDGIKARMNLLPDPTNPAFSASATELLGELRKLLEAAADAAHSAEGVAAAQMLSNVRRTYRDVMMRAAAAPGATLGQRLYAARVHADLTQEETATAAGVPVEAVRDAEAEHAPPADAALALENLIPRLAHF
jgi:DNA-binding transcriptional regulator YiaG